MQCYRKFTPGVGNRIDDVAEVGNVTSCGGLGRQMVRGHRELDGRNVSSCPPYTNNRPHAVLVRKRAIPGVDTQREAP